MLIDSKRFFFLLTLMSLILVFNAGSSSLKFKLFKSSSLEQIAKGTCADIGADKSSISIKIAGKEDINKKQQLKAHEDALQLILDELEAGVDAKYNISHVGHRVVHGGDHREPVKVTAQTLDQLDKLTELAPLHNHRAAIVMRAGLEKMPDSENYAYFDTMFHATIPEHIYTFPLPLDEARKNLVRKWGFHGLSHKYVAETAAKHIDKPLSELKLISLHLGNGCSACAVEYGKSLDTSMGLTPLSGLPGGTRSGDIDPSAVFHLVSNPSEPKGSGGVQLSKAEQILNKESGLKGLCGISHAGEIAEAAKQDTEQGKKAKLALDVLCNRIQNYIGSYYVTLQGADAIIFTAGIGEHSAVVRRMVTDKLKCIGCQVDADKNERISETLSDKGVVEISKQGSSVRTLVVETNEELRIAQLLKSKLEAQ